MVVSHAINNVMNYQQQFTSIINILRPYSEIWQREVIDQFRAGKLDQVYPKELIAPLREITAQEQFKVDCKRIYDSLPESDLKDLFNSLKSLEEVEVIDKEMTAGIEKLPSWAFHKVKGKKQYEILTIANFLTNLQKNKEIKFKHVVDIGGGVGHLSRTLAYYFGMDMISLDINPEFQEIGKKRLEKFPKPQGHKNVQFINHDFSIDLADEKNEEIFCDNSFSLGLHTCGPLAVKHMQVAAKHQSSGMLNFGCCYNKLTPKSDINLSNFAKENNPLEFGRDSCTLATRGHQSMTYEDFEQKRKVKYYRYCLQFYIDDIYGQDKEVMPIGDAHKRLYLGDFATYAKSKCHENNIPINFSDEEFEEYLKKHEDILETLFLCDIIRWQFGRALELYILIDRVMMLQEMNKEAKLMSFFDEEESPRNMGIWYYDKE
ncbi:methyltransferase [Halobacteriovorax vibrionivorans]|uniref:Methyltransferase n=2 Tax=Halobacteriovoraceae TaxID=1652132 RepID=A0ABY0IBR8_9BACT|nr:methyltransferase [Halobacteriovorax vibrionivorans]TGD46583.1 methyltransferase [Halobacteriovorax sp. Y22]